MDTRSKVRFVLAFVIGIGSLSLAARQMWTCSVPVFRYALERWKPDAYKGIFIHRGALSSRDAAMLRQLEDGDSNGYLNLLIRPVDVATFPREKLRELLKGPVPQHLPLLAIWYPDQMGKTAPLWKLHLTPASVRTLIDSPKRRELTEGLINGESIVWIFVPSGHSKKDERAKALIRKQLDLALEGFAGNPFYIQSGAKEKKLPYSFPIITLARTDPEERIFLDMLLGSESDLHEHEDEPMVFPVFGRGRSLGCLFGDYISEKRIQEVVAFLGGSCSCEVKELNPGKDLLLCALWDRVVMGELFTDDDTPLPELTGVMPEAPDPAKQPAAAHPARPRTAEPKAEKKSGILMTYGITLGSAMVAVVFAGLILTYRRKRDR